MFDLVCTVYLTVYAWNLVGAVGEAVGGAVLRSSFARVWLQQHSLAIPTTTNNHISPEYVSASLWLLWASRILFMECLGYQLFYSSLVRSVSPVGAERHLHHTTVLPPRKVLYNGSGNLWNFHYIIFLKSLLLRHRQSTVWHVGNEYFVRG